MHALELPTSRGPRLQRDHVSAQTGRNQTGRDGFEARGSFRVTGTGFMADEARIRRKEEHPSTVVLGSDQRPTTEGPRERPTTNSRGC